MLIQRQSAREACERMRLSDVIVLAAKDLPYPQAFVSLAAIDVDLPGSSRAREESNEAGLTGQCVDHVRGRHRCTDPSAPHQPIHETDNHPDRQSVPWIDESVQAATPRGGNLN